MLIALGSQKDTNMDSKSLKIEVWGEPWGSRGLWEAPGSLWGSILWVFWNIFCRCVGVSFLHSSPESLGGKLCFCFTDSGFFSSLCSLYSLPLSPSSALSGPPCLYRYIYIYSGKRLLMQAAGGCINRVPFRERMRGGESERGRKTNVLEEGPLTFWSIVAHFFDFSRPGMVKNHSVYWHFP